MNTVLTLLSAESIKQYYDAGFWRDDTIYSLVSGHAHRSPEKFALRDRFRRLSYRDLLAAADALAGDLARRGVRAGQRVAVWLPSRIEMRDRARGLLAQRLCRAVPSLHRDHTVGEIVELLTRTRAAALDRAARIRRRRRPPRYFCARRAAMATLRHVYRLEPSAETASGFAGLAQSASGIRSQARPEPGRLSGLHVGHDRHAEGRNAQRQHAARQCARDRRRLEHRSGLGGLFAQPAQPQSRLRRAW